MGQPPKVLYNLDADPGHLAKQIGQASTAQLAVSLDSTISYTQSCVLGAVLMGRGTTCSTLAAELGYDPGAMTRLLDGLEARGWLRRVRDRHDRRIVNLSLTAVGEEMAIAALRQTDAYWQEVFKDWSQADITEMKRLLTMLMVTLRARTASDASDPAD